MANNDQKIHDLLKLAEKKRAEIKKIEKPTWLTNCSFSFNPELSSTRVNLHTIQQVAQIVEMWAFLLMRADYFEKAAGELNVKKSDYVWQGYPIDQWKTDLQLRIDVIGVSKKKKQLELIEAELGTLLSPEEKERQRLIVLEELLSQD